MTLDQGFAYIESFTNLERNPGTSMRPYRLDRMRLLLDYFDNPEKACRLIHVAGSKGKGSTAAYLSSILKARGFRTGLYTKPHVATYRERITLAGKEFPDQVYVRNIESMKSRIEALDPKTLPGRSSPTTFELLTLLGFLMFRDAGCQWAVIETGIGGRLDATNVIVPEASVLTPIELEHTEVLGDTIAKIAWEKAGIIKPGVPAFCAFQREEAETVFRRIASERGSQLYLLRESLTSLQSEVTREGTTAQMQWSNGSTDEVTLSMIGEVQAENAALACLVAGHLFEQSNAGAITIDAAVRDGLRSTRLPGRAELLQSNPDIIIDGAHTPVSVGRLLTVFRRIYPQGGVLVFGSVLGKNAQAMAELLAPSFDHIIISTPGTFKQSSPQSVYEEFARHSQSIELVPDPEKALERALYLSEGRDPILVTGSFYLIAEILRSLRRLPL